MGLIQLNTRYRRLIVFMFFASLLIVGLKANVGNLFVCGFSESVNDNDPVWTTFYKQRQDFMDNKRTILRSTRDGLVVVGNQNLVTAN